MVDLAELEWLRVCVANWVAALAPSPVCSIDSTSRGRGGSLPGKVLPSCALVVRRDGISADELARRLRLGAQPIVPRIIDNQVAIDARTVLPGTGRGVCSTRYEPRCRWSSSPGCACL